MPIDTIPFSSFVPDGGDYGADLGLAENVLPVRRGWRPLQQRGRLATIAAGPVTGAYYHVYEQTVQLQHARPDADTSVGAWLTGAGTGTIFSQLNETAFSDVNYAYAGAAPTAQVLLLSLSDVTDPAVSGGHILHWRYRIPSTTGAWTVLAELCQSPKAVTSITNAGTTATVTQTAHGYATGQVVEIAGAAQAAYNGQKTITSTGANTYTFTTAGSPASPATGTITARGIWKADTASGTGAVTSWTQRDTTLSGTEADSIQSYADLFLRLTATVAGSTQFARPSADGSVAGYTTQAGGTTNLYQAIDETPASSTDYIQSPALMPGGASYTYQGSLGATTDPALRTGFTWRYRYAATNAGVTVALSLKQGSTVVKTVAHALAATSFTDASVALTPTEAALVTDFAALTFELTSSLPAAVASTVAQYARPASDKAMFGGNSWGNLSGGTPLYTEINEAGAADLSRQVKALIFGMCWFEVNLGTIPDPLTSAGHVVHVTASFAGPVGATQILGVELYQAGVLIASIGTQYLTTSSTEYTFTLTASEADSITDYSALYLRITQQDSALNANQTFVAQAFLETPAPRQGQLAFLELEVPSPARAGVSWVDFEVPDTNAAYKGDVLTLFASTKSKVYSVAEAGFTDLSGATTFGTGTKPSGGRFCSFGNNVIFTNYVDPVKYRADNAGNFADLITDPTPAPKARFCATIRNQLWLAGINLTGYYPDSVWWSGLDSQFRSFTPDPTSQANNGRIVSAPGQITGLVGGDYGVVFKRRSMHRVTWVGGTYAWRIDQISASVGTPYPNSIIQWGDAIYFRASSGFWRYDGSNLEEIGNAAIEDYFVDAIYSPAALIALDPTEIAIEDQLIVGAPEEGAGLLRWSYQAVGEAAYAHTREVFHNPKTGEWSTGYDAAAPTAFIVGKPNVTSSDAFILRGSTGFEWNGTNSTWFRNDGADTYPARFRSKKQSITLGSENKDDEEPRAATLRGVMPVFDVATLDGTWPVVTVTIEAWNDPQGLVNVQTQTYDTTTTGENGWLPIDLEAFWFRATVTIPSMRSKMMKAFLGLKYWWNPGGKA